MIIYIAKLPIGGAQSTFLEISMSARSAVAKLLGKIYEVGERYYNASPRLKKFLPRTVGAIVAASLLVLIGTALYVTYNEDTASVEVVYIEAGSYVDFDDTEPARVTVVELNSEDAEELSFDWRNYKQASKQLPELGWSYRSAKDMSEKVARQFQDAQGSCVVVTYQGVLREKVATSVTMLTEEGLRGFPRCGR